MMATSPSVTVTSSSRVATMPVPSVTIRIWSPLWVWNLLRTPAPKWTMPKLKLLLSSGSRIACRPTGPVNRGAVPSVRSTSDIFTIFIAAVYLRIVLRWVDCRINHTCPQLLRPVKGTPAPPAHGKPVEPRADGTRVAFVDTVTVGSYTATAVSAPPIRAAFPRRYPDEF